VIYPVDTAVCIKNPCHHEKNTINFTDKNFENGLIGCNSIYKKKKEKKRRKQKKKSTQWKKVNICRKDWELF